MPVKDVGSRPILSAKQAEVRRVSQALDDFCASLSPGDRVPTHTVLMRRFNASEHMVLRALDEMRRAGRIVRRARAGTFISDRNKDAPRAHPARTLVALARPDHSFFDRCMEQLSQYTERAGFDLVCRPLRPGREAGLTTETLGNPHGFVIFGYHLHHLACQFQDSGARVVMIGTPPFGVVPKVPSVYGAQMRGGYLAAKHLLDLGHRRLAYMHAEADQSTFARWHGMQQAIRDAESAGASISFSHLLSDAEEWHDDPDRVAAWVRRPEAPTGLLTWNDAMAVLFLSALARAGVRVPEEISIVGYDALPIGEKTYPALTTVEQYISEMLLTAVNLLNQSEPLPFSQTVIVPSLVIRELTAPPRLAMPAKASGTPLET